jgi:hypothetical protein
VPAHPIPALMNGDPVSALYHSSNGRAQSHSPVPTHGQQQVHSQGQQQVQHQGQHQVHSQGQQRLHGDGPRRYDSPAAAAATTSVSDPDFRTPATTDRRRAHPLLQMQESSSALLDVLAAVHGSGGGGSKLAPGSHGNVSFSSDTNGGENNNNNDDNNDHYDDDSAAPPGFLPGSAAVPWDRPALGSRGAARALAVGSPAGLSGSPGAVSSPARSAQYLSPRLAPIAHGHTPSNRRFGTRAGSVANSGSGPGSPAVSFVEAVDESYGDEVNGDDAHTRSHGDDLYDQRVVSNPSNMNQSQSQSQSQNLQNNINGRRPIMANHPGHQQQSNSSNHHRSPAGDSQGLARRQRPRPISTTPAGGTRTRRLVDDTELAARSAQKKADMQRHIAERTGMDVDGATENVADKTRNVAAIARWRKVLPATNALEDMRRSIAAYAELHNDDRMRSRVNMANGGQGNGGQGNGTTTFNNGKHGGHHLTHHSHHSRHHHHHSGITSTSGTPTRADGKLRSQMRSLERRVHDVRLWLHRRQWRTSDFFLFRSSLRKIEARSGTGVVSVFVFMRLIIILNVLNLLSWAALCIVPMILKDGVAHGFEDGVEFPRVLGGGGLEDTWVFFGGYPREIGGYRFDVAYFAAIALQYAVIFAALFRKMGKKMREKYDRASLVRRDRFYPFSSLVFSSWDHTITSKDAAGNLSRGIATSIQESLSDLREQVAAPATTRQLVARYAGRALGILLTLTLTVLVFIAVSLIIVNETQLVESTTVYIVPLAVSVCNVAFPFVIKFIVGLESYSPGTAVRQTISRTFALKLLTLLALVIRIYAQVTGDGTIPFLGDTTAATTSATGTGAAGGTAGGTAGGAAGGAADAGTATLGGDAASSCAETVIGIQIARLVIADAAVTVLSLLAFGAVGRWVNRGLQWDIPTSTLDAVYRAALHSLGSVFSPALPVLALLSNVLVFYVSKGVALWACAPPVRPWGAARTSTFFLFFLTLGMLVSLAPVVLFVRIMTPRCGPFGGVSAWDAMGLAIKEAPEWFAGTFATITSPVALLTIIAVLLSTLYFVRANLAKKRLLLDEAMTELEREHSEKITLIRDLKASFLNGSPMR